MGEAKTGVSADKRADAERLESEIAAIRAEIDEAIGVLDRRRRDLMDVRVQLARHALPLAAGALASGMVLAGAAVYLFVHKRNERRPSVRIHKARIAARRAVAHPERVARGEPPLHTKLLTASLTALAGATAKRLVERAITPSPRREVLVASPAGEIQKKLEFVPHARA